MEVNEIQDPEMKQIVEEVAAEEAADKSKTDEHKEESKAEETPEEKENPKEETHEDDPGKIDNQKSEENKPEDKKERVSRVVPVKKLQETKEKFREELAKRDEALELTRKQIEDLTKKVADLEKNGLTKDEKQDELEALAEKFDIPLEFLKEQEKIFANRMAPKSETKPEERPAEQKEEAKPQLSPEEASLLEQAKQDKAFEDEFKSTVEDEDLSDEDKELFKSNKSKVKELAFTEKYAKKSLTEIFLKAVKPEVTGSKSSEDGGINGQNFQKRIEDVTDDDLDKMSDEEAEEYIAKLTKRKK